jgi:hypothetical protein
MCLHIRRLRYDYIVFAVTLMFYTPQGGNLQACICYYDVRGVDTPLHSVGWCSTSKDVTHTHTNVDMHS